MASGLPVVATDDAMRRFLLSDAGIVCDVTDTNAYADSLTKALSNNWEDKPIRQAADYSWQSVAKRYASVIETL
jgi:glycosyltransferase involved in cell wall biosynthesis